MCLRARSRSVLMSVRNSLAMAQPPGPILPRPAPGGHSDSLLSVRRAQRSLSLRGERSARAAERLLCRPAADSFRRGTLDDLHAERSAPHSSNLVENPVLLAADLGEVADGRRRRIGNETEAVPG